MFKLPHGKSEYFIYTIDELKALGIEPNPYLYIGMGWFACPVCDRMTFFKGYSHKGQADEFLVCDKCKTCYRKNEIPNE